MATLTWNDSSGFNLADLNLSYLAYGIDYTRKSTVFAVICLMPPPDPMDW